ncbi:transcription-repair coupling factor [Chloroflexota bacterium]
MSLDLTKLLQLFDEMHAYRGLVNALEQGKADSSVSVLDAAKPYLIAALHYSLKRPIIVVTAQPEKNRKLYEQILTWSGPEQVNLFPESDVLPYENITSDSYVEVERLQVLADLLNLPGESGLSKNVLPLVVISAMSFMQKMVSYDDFSVGSHAIKVGMEIEPFELLRRWQSLGYQLESVVEVPGTMSHRGGIIDIYPITGDLPVRIEFFGNTVDDIRLFDPATQRSQGAVSSIIVTPATEVLAPLLNGKSELEKVINNIDLTSCNPNMKAQYRKDFTMLLNGEESERGRFYIPLFSQDTILNYLPSNGLLILDESLNIQRATEDLELKAIELRIERIKRGELPANFPSPFFNWSELVPMMKNYQCLQLTSWGDINDKQDYALNFVPARSYAGQLPALVKSVKQMLNKKQSLILVSHQASRLSELFEEEGMITPPLSEIRQVPEPGSLTLVQGLLGEGWIMNGDTCLLTDTEILGFIKQHRLLKKRPVSHKKLLVDINPGDYVVHVEHGIAKFTGVATMTTTGSEKEYLVLEYAAGDKLYIPTDQIDRVSRYIGTREQSLSLSRLGTQEWSRVKQRVKEAVADIAEELLVLYAAREVVPSFAFSADTVWQQELEASFPYIETPDQMEVQRQVKEDMEKPKPMDRLVCGDVGYGKTEVAIRAAFKAVMDNRQVAMLVPTTVLAEQHFSTFKQRLGSFPLRIEVLSRFRTAKEQQDIIEGLFNGSVDICIGTHRLIQKDVVFKDLGLLIIDEEQRFGVIHKEYLKKKRQEVDVLALSATPIPRTLHMSLVGVRDMSVMETPPEERLPIKTIVSEYSDHLVREAVLRELERNGQIFFVHNRVQSLALLAAELQVLIPEAKIETAHGQMPEAELEKVMAEFVQGKIDILVCTTIIESGLDMPNVNTLIVNQADKFGLTQLYQLRGRVGRGANLAYAYFLYEKGKHLTSVAEKRLKTIFEATELGAGFGIAMRDLEIRGAGTLLGVKQSGHISAVGFHLYSQLLAQAVEELKARRAGTAKSETELSRLPSPNIALPVPAYIPEEYITDLNTRLALYQKLSQINNIEEIEVMSQEFNDRFGALPDEVKNLLYVVRVKMLAARTGIESISTEHGEILLKPFEGMRFDRKKLELLSRDGLKFTVFVIRLNYRHLGNHWKEVLDEILKGIV